MILAEFGAYAQRRRPVEKLAAQGLLRRTRLMGYQITDAGRRALSSQQRQQGE
jgi:Mn-dependent DtxR family transcriptional regulator